MKILITLLAFTTALTAENKKIKNYWFNGAEISSYTLEQSRYGETYPGHAELIFVTEPFLIDKQVKNESNKPNSTPTLKLNALRTFNTGIYSYRTMTSTFRPINLTKFPHALKSTTTVQDWCGQEFQQFNYRNNTWKSQLHSYFEEQVNQTLTLPDAYLEDELWLTLRLDPKKLPTGSITIIPGAIYTRFHHADIAIAKAQGALTQDGKSSTYTLTYPTLNRTLTIYFGSEFPHYIQKWTEKTNHGTTTATLTKRLTNSAYWSLNKPKDTALRKQLNLNPIPK